MLEDGLSMFSSGSDKSRAPCCKLVKFNGDKILGDPIDNARRRLFSASMGDMLVNVDRPLAELSGPSWDNMLLVRDVSQPSESGKLKNNVLTNNMQSIVKINNKRNSVGTIKCNQ